MTALEAYALAKKIAISAVSGIKNLSVNGTTLTIETNDGNSLDMVFPTPADGRGITNTQINEDNHLIVTYDDGTTEDAGLIKGSDVQVTQLLSEGIKIAKIKVDGVNTDIYAPKGGAADCDYFIIDEIKSLPNNLTENDRRIYFCIEDGKYHLWNGTKWEIISSDVKIKELTQEEYNALSTAEKLNGTIYFITDAAGGGGGSAELVSALVATQTVGGVNAGKTYEIGTSLETIIRDILSPVLYPAFTNPSASISVSGNKILESGSSINKTFTVTFNRGSINPAYGTSGYRAGTASDYTLNGGTAQAENTFTETVSEDNKTFQATVSYAAGEQPKDSSGANYNSPLPAGSVTTNKITYEFVDCIWANTDDNDITEPIKQAITSKSTKIFRFDFPATSEDFPEVFDIPTSWTVTGIEVLNSLSNQWEAAEDQFSLSNITHKNASNTDVNYVRYTCNLGMDLGDRSVRVKWN